MGGLGLARLQRQNLQRTQCSKRNGDRSGREQKRLRQKAARGLTTATALPRGQLDETAGLELEQERASGHVLELAVWVAPVPERGQLDGELAARGAGRLSEQLLDENEVVGRDRAALDRLWDEHENRVAQGRFGVQHKIPPNRK